MNKVSKKIFLVVAVLVVALVSVNIYGSVNNRITTKIATIGTIENNINAEGYIIRDEYAVINRPGCFIDSMIEDGERVSKYDILATVYESNVDPSAQNEIKKLNERILSLENIRIAEGGIQRVESTDNFLKNKILSVVENSHHGKGSNLNEIYYELVNNIDENAATDNSSIQTLIDGLKAEKKQLEDQLQGEKTTVIAKDAGLYFSYTDGYETLLYPDMIKDLTVSAFNDLPDNFDVDNERTSAKLITGYDWYYSFLTDYKLADDFNYAEVITVKFEDNKDEDIKAYVYNISPEENGKCVVTCRVEKYVEHAFTNRKLSATVVIDSTKGLKIPRQAVRVVDGKTGVYIVKQSVARFRNIEIIASDEEYVIVKQDSADTSSLVVYDEVIVKGNIKKDGQSVG